MPKSIDMAIADGMFGEIIHVTPRLVIRLRDLGGQAQVIVHRRTEAGRELLPLGYAIGSNMLLVDQSSWPAPVQYTHVEDAD